MFGSNNLKNLKEIETIKRNTTQIVLNEDNYRNKYAESSRCLEGIWVETRQTELRLQEEKIKKEEEQKILEEKQGELERKYFRD